MCNTESRSEELTAAELRQLGYNPEPSLTEDSAAEQTDEREPGRRRRGRRYKTKRRTIPNFDRRSNSEHSTAELQSESEGVSSSPVEESESNEEQDLPTWEDFEQWFDEQHVEVEPLDEHGEPVDLSFSPKSLLGAQARFRLLHERIYDTLLSKRWAGQATWRRAQALAYPLFGNKQALKADVLDDEADDEAEDFFATPEMPSAESLRISIDSRPLERTSRSLGLDTVHFHLTDFTLDDSVPLKLDEGTTDTITGETTSGPLYKRNGCVIEGDRAWLNEDTYGFTIFDPESALVRCSLPKVVRASNANGLTTGKEIALAVQTLEKQMQEQGIGVDLFHATLSRVDIACTTTLSRKVPAYERSLRLLQFPQTKRQRYEGTGFLWRNGNRQLCFYDKGREQDKQNRASKTARLEYRLTGSKAVKQQIHKRGTLMDTLQDVTVFADAFYGATERLFDVEMDANPLDKGGQGVGTEKAFEQVLSSLEEQGERGADTKALLALAISTMDASTAEQYAEIVASIRGRQAKARFEKKVKKYQAEADVYRQDRESVAELYTELQDVFT